MFIEWYDDLASGTARVIDSTVIPISWNEFRAWSEDKLIRPSEIAILRKMDEMFCSEMRAEISAYHDRLNDEINKGKTK